MSIEQDLPVRMGMASRLTKACPSLSYRHCSSQVYLKYHCRLDVTNVTNVANHLARLVAYDLMKTCIVGSIGTAASTACRASHQLQTWDAISLSTQVCGSFSVLSVARHSAHWETWSATANHSNASTTMVELAANLGEIFLIKEMFTLDTSFLFL